MLPPFSTKDLEKEPSTTIESFKAVSLLKFHAKMPAVFLVKKSKRRGIVGQNSRRKGKGLAQRKRLYEISLLTPSYFSLRT